MLDQDLVSKIKTKTVMQNQDEHRTLQDQNQDRLVLVLNLLVTSSTVTSKASKIPLLHS